MKQQLRVVCSLVLAVIFLAAPATAAAPDGVLDPTIPCPASLGSCTANDANAVLTFAKANNGDYCSDPTDTIDINLTVTFSTTAANRYDFGLFVSRDGTAFDTATQCAGSAGQIPPFTDLDLDICGDLTSTGSPVTWEVQTNVMCRNVGGNLEIPTVLVWDNNGADPCLNPADAATGSKCTLSTFILTPDMSYCATTNCDDNNPCTDDSCDETGKSCVHNYNTAPCDDGNACTEIDVCAMGQCGGSAVTCDDSSACTVDTCDSTIGCVYTPTSCDDADTCTLDSCDASIGCTYTAISCDDNVACTTDSCDPATGCAHTLVDAACSDGLWCNGAETCDATQGCQTGAAPDCDDGAFCTTDTCNEGTDTCTHLADNTVCSDGNVCTDDICNEGIGCANPTNDTNTCSDNNACTTVDFCQAGSCTGTSPQTCSDENACTDDTCDPTTGCVFMDNSARCADGNACTSDICDTGIGCSHTPAICDDSNACTDDTCDGVTGCLHTDISASCDDGNVCDGSETCDMVLGCLEWTGPEGAPLNCDDGNPCTDDSCDAVSGCVNLNNGECCPAWICQPSCQNSKWSGIPLPSGGGCTATAEYWLEQPCTLDKVFNTCGYTFGLNEGNVTRADQARKVLEEGACVPCEKTSGDKYTTYENPLNELYRQTLSAELAINNCIDDSYANPREILPSLIHAKNFLHNTTCSDGCSLTGAQNEQVSAWNTYLGQFNAGTFWGGPPACPAFPCLRDPIVLPSVTTPIIPPGTPDAYIMLE